MLNKEQLADLAEQFPTLKENGSDTYEEFNSLFEQLDSEKHAETSRWKKRIGSVTGTYQVQGIAVHGADEIVHTIRVEEEVAFSNWINSSLSQDTDLKPHLPVNPEGGDLYQKVSDGLIICKLINLAAPETIDERGINKKISIPTQNSKI
uniref:Calponin-homology (CH) domain-containing protein n=1 Tax=Ditylenchus dipsaci TaxID=166011 RepID=A0A915EKU7_9BILA